MFKEKVPLAPFTTLQIGGQAEYFTEVNNGTELLDAVLYANEHNMPIKVLGGGSNLLISDDGVAGAVIKINFLECSQVISDTDVFLTVGAGKQLDTLVAETVSAGWWGLENLSHIPGSVGAAPVQNVGAYGVEAKDLIETVHVFDIETMEYVDLDNTDCQFGYRDSIFKSDAGKKYVVASVTFRLSTEAKPQLTYRDLTEHFKDKEPTLDEIRQAVIKIRAKKFPDWKRVGTAGSFFKNPIITAEEYGELENMFPDLPCFRQSDGKIKVPLGWILDKTLGLKGYNDGNVGTYEGQALVIVNRGGATAKNISAFAEIIARKVKDKMNITIEWEVTRW